MRTLLVTTPATDLEKSIATMMKSEPPPPAPVPDDDMPNPPTPVTGGALKPPPAPVMKALDALDKSCGNLVPAATDTDVSKKKKKNTEKSFKRYTVPKAGSKVRKPEKDPMQKRQERQQRRDAGVKKAEMRINPTNGTKNPLLVNTHGEEFHDDAHQRSMEFVISEGPVLLDDPVYNPRVTPELDGFPLALPNTYTGKSELFVPSDDELIISKALGGKS